MLEMTLAELSRRTNTSRKVLEGMIHRGTLGSRRDGGRIIVTIAEASRVFPHVDFTNSPDDKDETTGDSIQRWKERAEAAEREAEILRKLNELLERQIVDLMKDKENLYLLLTRTTASLPHKRTQARDGNGRFVKAGKDNVQGSLIAEIANEQEGNATDNC